MVGKGNYCCSTRLSNALKDAQSAKQTEMFKSDERDDLKAELDTTRQQVARMKRAGMGDSVETEKAISQLQEALGTIQILQESLDEAELVNLEVDTLRSNLADAMESQMTELQRSDDEKKQLRQHVQIVNNSSLNVLFAF